MPLTGILIFIVIGGLFIGALFSPILGVAGYLAVYLLYDPDIWWGQYFAAAVTRPSFVAMILLAVSCVVHVRKIDLNISRTEIWLYLFLPLAWLVSAMSGLGLDADALLYLDKLTKLLIFIFLFNRVVNTLKNFDIVLWALIGAGAFLGFQARGASPGQFVEGRLEELGGIDFKEANQLAGFLALAIILLGYKLLQCKWPLKIAYVLGIALMLNAIVMTQSRAVFLGMIVAAPFVFITAGKEHRKLLIVCLCLGLILFLTLADVKFISRMDTIQDSVAISGRESDSQLTRVDFWKAAMRMVKDHPFGVGVKHFAKLVPEYDPRNKGMDAHNTYVLCVAELGIPGIILFLLIIAKSFQALKRGIRAARTLEPAVAMSGKSVAIALIVFVVGLMTTHSILYSEMLWILLSLGITFEKAVKHALNSAEMDKASTSPSMMPA